MTLGKRKIPIDFGITRSKVKVTLTLENAKNGQKIGFRMITKVSLGFQNSSFECWLLMTKYRSSSILTVTTVTVKESCPLKMLNMVKNWFPITKYIFNITPIEPEVISQLDFDHWSL